MRTGMLHHCIPLVTLSLLLLLCCACGGGKSDINIAKPVEKGFSLNVWPESHTGEGAAAAFNLSTEESEGETIVEIQVSAAQNLKALLYDLSYDPARYTPISVETTNKLAQPDDLLCLSISDVPGSVHHGQVLQNWPDRDGFTGDGVLARVRFAHRPHTPGRVASLAPTAEASQTELSWNEANYELTWLYFSQGDYDQNGEVNISDLTPLGREYKAVATGTGFPVESALSVIDGDGNGEINIADITPIGANYFASATGGYNIYESTDDSDYPATAETASSITPLANVSLANATGTAANDRLAFNYTVTSPLPGGWYWVRPMDDQDNEGIASNIVEGLPPGPALSLTNPPSYGAGTDSDPYVVNDIGDYVFSVVHPDDGDVSTDANTTYTVTPTAAGTISNTDATLNLTDDYTGGVEVSATYNGEDSIPPTIYLTAPLPAQLMFTNPPTQGSGTEIDPYWVNVQTVYNFVVIDPVNGDVTTSPDCQYFAKPASAASFALGQLDVEDTYSGYFNVLATYRGIECLTQPAAEKATSGTDDWRRFFFFVPVADALYAIPEKYTAYEGEPVRITVITHEAANPFQYLNGTRVTYELGNTYVPHSFNVGAPGGDQSDADGVWTDVSPTSFLTPPDFLMESKDIGGGLAASDFNITPIGGSDVLNATGSLLNFELVCNSDVHLSFQAFDAIKRTYYSDSMSSEYDWGDITNTGVPPIIVSGPPPVLALTNPPVTGSGTAGDPYVADVDTDYIFSLTDPVAGDVSTDPATEYEVTPPTAGSISNTDATLNIEDSFAGLLHVEATYNGVSNSAESTVYMIIPSEYGFVLDIWESETYIYGGSADSWSVTGVDLGTQVEAQINVTGASDLKALYFDLAFENDNLNPVSYGNTDAMDDVSALLLPSTTFVTGSTEPGTAYYGHVMVNPQTATGFDGDGVLVSLYFDKTPGPTTDPPRQPPSAPESEAQLSWNPWTSTITIYYYNVGDYNQNGGVALTDLTPLAVHFGDLGPVFPPNSIERVVDGNNNGEINVSDLTPMGVNWLNTVEEYNIYTSTVMGDYPSGGTLLDTIAFYTFGDETAERCYMEYTVFTPVPDAYYWVKPVYDGTEGQVSALLQGPVPPPLTADTLYAIPDKTEAVDGEVVTVTVRTGVPANPFHFMDGVRVTFESGNYYVTDTFNVGEVGGQRDSIDGIWADMSPSAFLLPEEWMFVEDDIGGGRVAVDFNVTPIGGPDLTTSEGALFNFGLEVHTSVTLGFQQFHDVNRTFYSDNGSSTYFWGDITNSHAGFDNSITLI